MRQLIVPCLLITPQLFQAHLSFAYHLLVHLLYRLQSGRVLVYVQVRARLVIQVGTFGNRRTYPAPEARVASAPYIFRTELLKLVYLVSSLGRLLVLML